MNMQHLSLKKHPSSTKASLNKKFAFGHKLLCPEDAQSDQKQLDNQQNPKVDFDDDLPVSFNSGEDEEEVWDSDDKPESEEKDDVILDKFKVLNSDPDDKHNTPETKASKDKEDVDEMEKNKEKWEMIAAEEVQLRHDTEEAERIRLQEEESEKERIRLAEEAAEKAR